MGNPASSSPLRDALRHSSFRRLWIGQTVSAVGDQIFPIAIVALVIGRGGSAGALALVFAARSLAAAALVIVGGLFADRFQRTRVMIGADAIRLVAVLGLAAAAGRVPVLGLVALTFLVGLGEAFFRPAYSALMPTILPAESLRGGNALTALAMKVGTVAGPLIAGALVAATGSGAAFVIDAATFGVSLLTLVRVAEPKLHREPRTGSAWSVFAESREGLAAVRERPWLRRTLIVGGIQQVAGIGPLLILLPLVTAKSYGESGFGLVLACFGGGSILGAVLGGRLQPAKPGYLAVVGMSVAALPLLALAGPAPLWTICAAFIVAGVGMEVFGVIWETALQLDVPEHLLGRVFSLDWLTTFGLLPLGMAVGGSLSAHVGVAEVAIGCAVVILLTGPTILLAKGGARMASGEPAVEGEPAAEGGTPVAAEAAA